MMPHQYQNFESAEPTSDACSDYRAVVFGIPSHCYCPVEINLTRRQRPLLSTYSYFCVEMQQICRGALH